MMKKLQHHAEAIALRGVFALFSALPLDAASALGGAIARTVGPFLSAQKTGQKNLREILPEYDEAERKKIIRDMWDNLGRMAAELPHIKKGSLNSRITMMNTHNIPANNTMFYFSGHFGNWELFPLIGKLSGRPITFAYREANNKIVDNIIVDIRRAYSHNMFPKGVSGAIKMARAIKNNEAIALLVDQKMNDGIAAPFFGRNAMTAPAIAELALRHDIPIIPARVVRTKGAHFEAYFYPALAYTKTDDKAHDVLTIMTAINEMLEDWIRQHPAQWFWVHKRWPAA